MKSSNDKTMTVELARRQWQHRMNREFGFGWKLLALDFGRGAPTPVAALHQELRYEAATTYRATLTGGKA